MRRTSSVLAAVLAFAATLALTAAPASAGCNMNILDGLASVEVPINTVLSCQ